RPSFAPLHTLVLSRSSGDRPPSLDRVASARNGPGVNPLAGERAAGGWQVEPSHETRPQHPPGLGTTRYARTYFQGLLPVSRRAIIHGAGGLCTKSADF